MRQQGNLAHHERDYPLFARFVTRRWQGPMRPLRRRPAVVRRRRLITRAPCSSSIPRALSPPRINVFGPCRPLLHPLDVLDWSRVILARFHRDYTRPRTERAIRAPPRKRRWGCSIAPHTHRPPVRSHYRRLASTLSRPDFRGPCLPPLAPASTSFARPDRQRPSRGG